MKTEDQMTDMPDLVVGLDIGTTKIATIIGYKADDKIDIIGHGRGESTGVQHGLIYNINKTVDGINISKEQAEKRTDCFKVNQVYVGVAGRHIKSIEYKHVLTRINGKNFVIKQEEIDRMLNDLYNISVPSGERIITVIPQHYVVDKEIDTTEPVGMLGELIEGYFQLITGNESEIKKILLCVESAGLKAEDIILEPIASGLSCLSEEEKRQGVALVDIGGGTTDLAIYYDGSPVYTKVIPIGGTIITRDIATVCQITEELAEKLKITCGTCIVEKSNSNHYITLPQFHAVQPRQINETHLAKIINMRVQNDILDQVKREIDNSGYADKLRAGVVLTGGGATLRHIKELCQFTLQKPVRIGIPEFGFVRNIPTDLKHPMYATALGLLKYGIGKKEAAAESEEEEKPVVVEKPVAKKPEKKKEPERKKRTDNDDDKMWGEGFIMKKVKEFLDGLVDKTS
jgi:cell division protein FtsA